MLLKVDVYPSTTGEAFPGATREPDETVYVCLATTGNNTGGSSTTNNKENDAGRLLTVGRKSGDIMLGKDKSVSREHCVIRMVTTNKTLPKKDDAGKNVSPLPARTVDEQTACQESSFYQCSIVIENIGRLGTYILEESTPKADTAAANTNADDSDTDDEAEMMMISQPGGGGVAAASQASQLPLSTWVRNLVAGDDAGSTSSSRPIQTRPVHNNSAILKELDADHGRVVVLCGRQESILVLTRVPIYVQRTKAAFSKSSLPPWWSMLHTIGTVDLSEDVGDVLSPQTTHLITSERTSSFKQLHAWLKGIHFVKAEYLEALLQRKSPRDAFPDIANYVTPCPPGQDFFAKRPVENVWKGLTYISMKRDDEWEDVVRAMGSSVRRLYEEVSSDQDEDQMYREILSQFDTSCTWSIDVKGRRYTQPLKSAKIPLFNPKQVARGVVTSNMLPGLTPNTGPKSVLETQSTKTRRAAKASTQAGISTVASPNPSTTPKEVAKSSTTSTSSKENSTTGPTDQTKTASQRSRRAARSLPSSDDSESDSEPIRRRSQRRNTPRSTQQSPAKGKSDSESDTEIKRRQDGALDTKQQTTPSAGKEETGAEKQANLDQQENEQETVAMEDDEPLVEDATPAVQEDATENVSETTNTSKEKESSTNKTKSRAPDEFHDAERRPAKRPKVATAPPAKGWLQAVPSGKKRSEHARSAEEIVKVYEGDGAELYTKSAETEWAPKPTAKEPPSNQQASKRRRRDTGPNFKAFRKNRVPPVQTVQYQWKSHRSVPAVQQAQMEEEQREADIAFQRANELFKDVTRSTASSRRRKLQ